MAPFVCMRRSAFRKKRNADTNRSDVYHSNPQPPEKPVGKVFRARPIRSLVSCGPTCHIHTHSSLFAARSGSGSFTSPLFKVILRILICSALLVSPALGSPMEDRGEGNVETLTLSPAEARYRLGRFAEILEDPEKTWSIDEVASPPLSNRFRSVGSDAINAGVTSSALWIRFTLVEPERSYLSRDKSVQWILDMGRTHFYEETLYVPVPQPQKGSSRWTVPEIV